jgi:hypothetical protein
VSLAWEAEQDMDGGGNPLDSWSAYWIDRDGDALALIEGTDRDTAKLIAAAPDMLAALRGLVCELESIGSPAPGLVHARAAIAKATGSTVR